MFRDELNYYTKISVNKTIKKEHYLAPFLDITAPAVLKIHLTSNLKQQLRT